MIEKLKQLKANSGFMRYFKNTSWLLGEKVLRILAAITVGLWVQRYLGPGDWGVLSHAQSFVAILAAFSSLGLTEILSRDLVSDAGKKLTYLGTAFILQTIGSVVLMCLIFGSFYFDFVKETELTRKIIIILGLLTFVNRFSVITTYFLSIVKNEAIVKVSMLNLIFSTILKVLLITYEAPLIYFVYVLVFDTLFLAIGWLIVYTKHKESIFKWKFSLTAAKQMLGDSWPLILNLVFASIYMKIDQVMIMGMLDSVAVGQYASAVFLSQAWYFVPTIIASSLFPAIVNAKKQSETLYYDRLQKLYDMMVLFAIAIAIPMTFLSDFFVSFLLGDEFPLTGGVLSIHIWAGVFVFLGQSTSKWALTENIQRYSSVCLFMGMLCNIALNIIVIPRYGIFGAAVATIISQSISVFFAPILFKKTRPSFIMMLKALTFTSLFQRVFRR